MRRHLPYCLLLTICALSCKNDQSSHRENSPTNLVLESTSLQLTDGDCNHDKIQSNCAEISLSFPAVKSGLPALQQNVSTWAHNFLISLLDPASEHDEETSLNAAIEGFLETYKKINNTDPGLPGHFTLTVTDTILLQNDQHFTLRMDAYSYAGGAHPNSTAAIATFDIKSGKQLRPVDMVKDLEKLYAAAELKFRETQKEAFADGFDFTQDWPFVTAENVGLTTEGLFFCYVPNEVTPNAMGFTEFVIPYDELEKL